MPLDADVLSSAFGDAGTQHSCGDVSFGMIFWGINLDHFLDFDDSNLNHKYQISN